MTNPSTFFRARAGRLGAALFLLVGASAGCASSGSGTPGPGGAAGLPVLDSARLISDLTRLSHDSMAGRATGTPENAKARAFLVGELQRIGIPGLNGRYEYPFQSARRNRPDSVSGVNVLGYLEGARDPLRVIVVSAHYDHVGVRNGDIYNGADDNASGTAGVLALAAYFKANPPQHSMLFVLFDAEEMGLLGARALVASPPIPLARIGVNVNLDMVSRSDQGELWAAGAAHYPQLRPFLEGIAPLAPMPLRLGHDSGPGRDDWTNLSDQGAFHAVQIPSLLFSVEDHVDYHKPTDDAERIQPAFYYGAIRTVAGFLTRLDAALPPR
jgi:Zn-dependent M28 family amino/carboxypeptidase